MKAFAPKGENIYAQGSKPTGIGKIVATARKSISYQTENYAFALAGRGLLYIPAYRGVVRCAHLPGLVAKPPSSGLIGLSARSHQRSVRLRRDVVPARRFVTPASRLVTPARRFVTPTSRLVTPARRFVTYRPRDGKFTARGTACLPPEGRHVYRPRGGK